MHSTKRRDREPQAGDEFVNAPDVRERPGDDDIARRAYERYEARGRTDGYALDDWLSAGRELTGAERRNDSENPA